MRLGHDKGKPFSATFKLEKETKNTVIQKVSEQLGVEKMIPNVLPDDLEVR